MVTVMSLWLPILVSAVFVFIVSSVIHMLLPYHRSDFGKIPSEDEAMDAWRGFNIPPGDYIVPFAGSTKVLSSTEFIEKTKVGPCIFMTVLKNGPQPMAGSLVLWFFYSVVISVFSGYIASRALGPEAHYLQVFRFVGSSAFMGYSLALLQNSIWYKRQWSSTIKSMFDGLIYALVTAGVFGWLWPRM